ncbi:MAG: CHASE2 domain-containing protein, partial [Gallionella sp.]|nr:CHASE2 domain-containing protein [Gallionella sp.]
MKKTSFWKADWFFAAVLAVVFLFGANTDLIQSLERKAYDWGVRASSRQPSDRIAIIAIDEPSIANLGRWPWPREIQAKLVDILAEGHAKVVGQTALFFEPQVDPGLDYILNIAAVIEQTDLAQTHPEQWLELQGLMQEALLHLDNDQKMADSMGKINNVLLGLYFELGEPQGNPDAPLPDYVLKNALSNVQAGADAAVPIPAFNALVPIPLLGQRALAMGHLNATPDVDGGVRTEPLVISYYDQYYPSLSLMLAAKSLNLEAKDIQVTLGEGVRLGNLQIATDPALRMNTYFYADRDGRPAFQVDSFYDVITGKIPAEKYRDKIVLIGATAAGVGSVQVTPVSAVTPPVLTLAHSVSSILKQDFFVTPTWSVWAELATFLLIALYLILLLPRL